MKQQLHRNIRTARPTVLKCGLPAQQTDHDSRAFTLVECLAVVAALALLACVALPVLAGTKGDAQRAACMNNLRQIGQAWAGWGNEHGDLKPPNLDWQMTFNIPQSQKQNTWRHYSFLTNHLASPQSLACPSDSRTRMVSDWNDFPRATNQAKALSYFMGMHALPEYPQEVLGGDPNIGVGSSPLTQENCQAGVQAHVIPDYWSDRVQWTNAIHGTTGNILRNDGQVQSMTSDQLRQLTGPSQPLARPLWLHILQPK